MDNEIKEAIIKSQELLKKLENKMVDDVLKEIVNLAQEIFKDD